MERFKIFIIDDDINTLGLYQRIFKKENFDVFINRGEPSAYERIAEVKPDIIILDLFMSDNSGFHIIKQLKQNNSLNSIPIVVVTSHHNYESKIELLREGVVDYIHKPFQKEELSLRIKNYVHCFSHKNNHTVAKNENNIAQIQTVTRTVFGSSELTTQLQTNSQRSDLVVDLETLKKIFNKCSMKYYNNIGFIKKLNQEISESDPYITNITVMSIGLENIELISSKLDKKMVIKLFKDIVYVIKKYIRMHDVVSFSEDFQRILIMLPNTHLNMAKIIADKIKCKVSVVTYNFPLEIKFASYPQDGRNAEEILTMMDLGIEKIGSDIFQ